MQILGFPLSSKTVYVSFQPPAALWQDGIVPFSSHTQVNATNWSQLSVKVNNLNEANSVFE